MAWRPMPFDGGYLPITEMTRAVLDTGFRGVFSMEVFDGGPDGKLGPFCLAGRFTDSCGPGKGRDKDAKEYTKKSMSSLRRLVKEAEETPL